MPKINIFTYMLTSASWKYIRSFKIREQAEFDFFPEARPLARLGKLHGSTVGGRGVGGAARPLAGSQARLFPLCAAARR